MTRAKGMTAGELVNDLKDLPSDTPIAVQIGDQRSLLDAIVLHGGKKGFSLTMRALPMSLDIEDGTPQAILPDAPPVDVRRRTVTSKKEVNAEASPLPRERIILLDTDQRTKIGETDVIVERAGVLPEAVEIAGTPFIHKAGRQYRLARQVKVALEKAH